MDIAETSPLERIAAMARFVFSSLAMLFGLPEAMAERPLGREEHKLARAWVRELERFARGLVYALALQLKPTLSPCGRGRRGRPSEPGEGCERRLKGRADPPQPTLSRSTSGVGPPSPTRGEGRSKAPGFRLSSPVHGGGGARQRAGGGWRRRRSKPLASALFATERLAARFAAAEQVLANPEPLARRLARRWARNAAAKARDLAHAAKPPAKSHTGKAAPYRSGDFDEPPRDTLRRVLLYENRCELAEALATLAAA